MTKESKNEFMLLFRNTDWHEGLSLEEMQRVAGEWMAWFKNLSDQGKVVGGHPLESAGKVVSGKKGRIVSDGPFAEAKENIGGYFLLQVATMEEAVEIAQQCPGLPYGAKVEVRAVLEQCPMLEKAETHLEMEAV